MKKLYSQLPEAFRNILNSRHRANVTPSKNRMNALEVETLKAISKLDVMPEPIVNLIGQLKIDYTISGKYLIDCIFNSIDAFLNFKVLNNKNTVQNVYLLKAEHISSDNVYTEISVNGLSSIKSREVNKIPAKSGTKLSFYDDGTIKRNGKSFNSGDKCNIIIILPKENCSITFGFEFKIINNALVAKKISEAEEFIDCTLLDSDLVVKLIKNNIERFDLIEESLGVSLGSIGIEIVDADFSSNRISFNLSLEICLVEFNNKVRLDIDVTCFDENNNILNNTWVRNVNLFATSPFHVQVWYISSIKLPSRIRIFPKGEKQAIAGT